MTTPYTGGYYYGQPHMWGPNNIPVIKNYSINVSGPEVDHVRLSSIFEDMLPINNIKETYNSLSERLTLNDFIRSVFIKKHDGENIDLSGVGGEDCLVSYLKFVRLNPNVTKVYAANPYKNLPDNTLIYKSCYPIRYDEATGSVSCAKKSVSINVRIHKMSVGEYYVKQDPTKSPGDYDLWREVYWYEIVREKILKKKMCPNFVNMYSYFIEENSKVDFSKLEQAKTNPSINSGLSSQTIVSDKDVKEALEKNPDAYSGKTLIMLTESPQYNIYGWASKTYEKDGNIKRMINTGFHTEKVWFSVIFQIMAALSALQKQCIAFRNYVIDENIFIKEISKHENNNTFWKYNINGIDFYVPNEGFLVMFDSSYKNLDRRYKPESKKPKYKICSNDLGGKKNIVEDINKLAFKSFLSTISPNTFSKTFENAGGVKPPSSVLKLLEAINTDANTSRSKDISDYIVKFMTMFMNNRVGTYLDENEALNVRPNDRRDFRKGQMIVCETESDSFKFVTYLGDGKTPGFSTVITKNDMFIDSKETTLMDVPTSTLHHYSRFEPIVQKFVPGEPVFANENMLESYRM
jgi:hypothetical protein